MKKYLSIILMLLMLCGCANTAAPAGGAPTWQEQYDLGMRYLGEGNYMEAILAFSAAIEIEPKQAQLYLGRADAYRLAAEQTGDAKQSIEYYEKAAADAEEAVRLGDPSAEAKAAELREAMERLKAAAEAETLLETLGQTLKLDDIDQVKALMRQEDYQALSAAATRDAPIVYEGDDGTVLAVYPDNYYYFGQWSNHQRSGQGLWIRVVFDDERDLYTYQGSWANDLPNGEGEIVSAKDAAKLDLEQGYTTSVRTEISGTFKDGLYHGTIHETWHMNDGGMHIWSPITVVDGVYQQMSEIPETVFDYERKSRESGSYLVAIDTVNQMTDLWNNGSVHSVSGVL